MNGVLEGQFYAEVFALRSLDTYIQYRDIIQKDFQKMGELLVDAEGWFKCPDDQELSLYYDSDLNDIDQIMKRISVVKHLAICMRCQMLMLWKEWKGKVSQKDFFDLADKLREEGYLD